MDRSHSKERWLKTIRNHMKGIVDVHSMQGNNAIFERWNLFQEFFTELFDGKMKMLMDKYGIEYAALLNISLNSIN